MTEDGQFIIVRTVADWAAQADRALGAITDANGGTSPATLRDAYDVDPAAFVLLIEAMVALEPHTGQKVGDDMVQLAGLRPVGEVI